MTKDIRTNITDTGYVIISIRGEAEALDHNEVNALINILKTAQADAKELNRLRVKKEFLVKNYNAVGRPIQERK
jgi:hypothetical protein